MANSFIAFRSDIIIIGQRIFAGKIPEDLDIPVGMDISCKDIVIRENYQFVFIPDLRFLPEF